MDFSARGTARQTTLATRTAGIVGVIGLAALVMLAGARNSNAESSIGVPIRFHIVSDLVMQKEGLVMRSWVTERHLRNTIVPEVNRIWRQADVRFEIDGVVERRTLNPPDRHRLIDDIVHAHRNSDGESDPDRIRNFGELIDLDADSASPINVYLVPYLGEASQGNTKRRLGRIFLGQWSDKSSRAREAPGKVLLTESEPFRQGSLGRTLAHELGHMLGLKHPDKSTTTRVGLLMGGRLPGYDLTDTEIRTARKKARRLADGRPVDSD